MPVLCCCFCNFNKKLASVVLNLMNESSVWSSDRKYLEKQFLQSPPPPQYTHSQHDTCMNFTFIRVYDLKLKLNCNPNTCVIIAIDCRSNLGQIHTAQTSSWVGDETQRKQ